MQHLQPLCTVGSASKPRASVRHHPAQLWHSCRRTCQSQRRVHSTRGGSESRGGGGGVGGPHCGGGGVGGLGLGQGGAVRDGLDAGPARDAAQARPHFGRHRRRCRRPRRVRRPCAGSRTRGTGAGRRRGGFAAAVQLPPLLPSRPIGGHAWHAEVSGVAWIGVGAAAAAKEQR